MLALVVMSGSAVLLLGSIWISERTWKVKSPVVDVEIIEIATDADEGMTGEDRELVRRSLSIPVKCRLGKRI